MWIHKVVCMWLLGWVALSPPWWIDPKYLTIWGKPLKSFNLLNIPTVLSFKYAFPKKTVLNLLLSQINIDFYIILSFRTRRPIWPLHTFIRPSTIINQKIVDFFLRSHGCYKLVYNFVIWLKQNSYFTNFMSNLKLIIMILSPTLYPLLVEYL
jgi:hypothetical protein